MGTGLVRYASLMGDVVVFLNDQVDGVHTSIGTHTPINGAHTPIPQWTIRPAVDRREEKQGRRANHDIHCRSQIATIARAFVPA